MTSISNLENIFLSDAFNTVVRSSQIIAGVGAAAMLAAGWGYKESLISLELFQNSMVASMASILPAIPLTHIQSASNDLLRPQ